MNDFLPRFGGLRSLTKPISSKRYALFFVKAEKKGKEIGGIPPAEVGNFLHILYGDSKQALFGNLREPPRTAITEVMQFFGIGKTALHRFLSSPEIFLKRYFISSTTN